MAHTRRILDNFWLSSLLAILGGALVGFIIGTLVKLERIDDRMDIVQTNQACSYLQNADVRAASSGKCQEAQDNYNTEYVCDHIECWAETR